MPRMTLKRRPSASTDSPGLSSVPASIAPIMQQAAPEASAFTTSPEYLMPPSAMTGTSPAPRTASMIAVTCGMPTPVTTRVVQMLPGPTPTFTASAPRRTISRAPASVATLPATSCTSGKASRSSASVSRTPSLWPCAESMTSTSAPASTRARARTLASGVPPTAAATRSRPCWSLLASGCAIRLKMSLTVMSPRRTPWASTTGSFSIRCRARMRSASSSVVPTGRGDQVVLGHRLADRLRQVALELEVAVGHDPDEAALGVHDRHARRSGSGSSARRPRGAAGPARA